MNCMWCVFGEVLFRGIRVVWIAYQFFLSSCSFLCFYSRNSPFIVTLETSEMCYLFEERRKCKIIQQLFIIRTSITVASYLSERVACKIC